MADLSKLKELKALLDDGVLTQEEFDEQKAKILAAGDEATSEPAGDDPDPPPTKKKKKKASSKKPGDERLAEMAGGLGMILLAIGLAIVGYRLLATMVALYSATLMSMCCCGCIEPDEISGGFGGAWEFVGEAFELDTGDALGQIIYFGSWDPVFYTGCGIFGLGVLMTVVAMMTED